MKQRIVSIIIFCLLFSLFQNSIAGSIKTTESSAIQNFAWVMYVYREEKKDTYPKSWQDFKIFSQNRFTEIIDNAKHYVDIENRYIFLNETVSYDDFGTTSRMIMIATDSELEGARHRVTENGVIREEAGRYAIIEKQDGEIRHRRFPEVVLEKIFEEQGLDLKNYSKKRTFFPPPKRETRDYSAERQNLYPERYKRPEKENEIVNTDQNEPSKNYTAYFFIGLLTLLISTIVLKKKP